MAGSAPSWTVLFALLVTTLVASGCIDSNAAQDDADHAPANALPDVFGFHPPIPVGDASGTVVIGRGEAFVASHGDEMLVCTHGNFVGPALTWASRDGGASFTLLTFPPEAGVAGDCDVRIAPDGTWYVLHSTVEGATLTASNDHGTTWRANPVTILPISMMADRPWLQVTADGTLYLTGMNIYVAPGFVSITKSTDGGETWAPPTLIATPGGPESLQHMNGRPFEGQDGRIFVPIRTMQDTNAAQGGASFGGPSHGWVSLMASDDAGDTWTELAVTEPRASYSSFPMASVTADGTLVFVEPLPLDDGVALHAIVSRDNGDTWTEPTPITAARPENGQAWAHGGPDGTATAAWVVAIDGNGADEKHLEVVRINTAGGATGAQAIDLGPSSTPEFLMVTHDDNGKARIVHTSQSVMWLHTET